jgi:hypothetical protein
MKREGKYRPLFDYLSGNRSDEITLTLSEIETLLGNALPASARTTRGWWSNRDRGSLQAAAWMDAGYQVAEVDLAAEKVIFRKALLHYEVKRAGDIILWDGDLAGVARPHGRQPDAVGETLGAATDHSEWRTCIPRPSHIEIAILVAERAGRLGTCYRRGSSKTHPN